MSKFSDLRFFIKTNPDVVTNYWIEVPGGCNSVYIRVMDENDDSIDGDTVGEYLLTEKKNK